MDLTTVGFSDFEQKVYNALDSHGQRAIDITRSLGLPTYHKSRVNEALYQLAHKSGCPSGWAVRINEQPPRWAKAESQDVPETSATEGGSDCYVFVDADNSPCLKELEPYASPEILVWSCASPAYNHHQPENSEHLSFHKVHSDLPNAADVRLIFEMQNAAFNHRMLNKPKGSPLFVVVSKDKLIATAAMEIERMGFKTAIVRDGWEGLKIYVE